MPFQRILVLVHHAKHQFGELAVVHEQLLGEHHLRQRRIGRYLFEARTGKCRDGVEAVSAVSGRRCIVEAADHGLDDLRFVFKMAVNGRFGYPKRARQVLDGEILDAAFGRKSQRRIDYLGLPFRQFHFCIASLVIIH
ncbi:hypothetical protein SDC9_208125 [bioreactor metagenome]|uniref:Uncharacterized protein n=1 Tax=bioreactor metagenome TaxID=1076179 RepID=A0A645JAG9_9ZZZZ